MAGVPRLRRRVDGVLLLDKRVGMTSNGALQAVKRLFEAEKAGHTGTLDPFASGLLPLCFGDATKFAQMLLDADKSYVATVHFGIGTATGDRDGQVTANAPADFDRAAIEDMLPRFLGRIAQVPPMFSALKRDGRPYYEYARNGIELARVPRDVDVHALALDDWSPPLARISVRCGKGTYVRVLAEDLGRALGSCAHLSALRRTTTGSFAVADALSLDELAGMPPDARSAMLLPPESLLAGLPVVDVDDASATALRQGKVLATPALAAGRYRCRGPRNVLIGVVEASSGTLRGERLCRTDRAENALAPALPRD